MGSHTIGTPPADARGMALYCLRHGYAPIPLPCPGKRPVLDGWQNLRLTPDDLDRHFPAGRRLNVGVLNGEPSGGLVDIDLDCPEARRAAPLLMPDTGMVSGRASAPDSHWWYVTDAPPAKAATNYDDPTDADNGHLLELRSTGGQTVLPPSLYPADEDKGHPHPEPCVWHRAGLPSRVSAADLRAAAGAVAAAALLARHWGPRRNALACGVAGGLLRAGWSVERVETFLAAVCAAAGDEEPDNRVGAVAHTAEKLNAGGNVTGWPTVANTIGVHGEAVVAAVRDWLRVAAQKSVGGAGTEDESEEPEAWPAPIRLPEHPDVPPYPADILPDWLREWAQAQATSLQVPLDLPASLGLGFVSAAIGRRVVAEVRDGFTEPTNRFVMGILEPGERKTQTFKRAAAPVRALQKRLREEAAPVIVAAESDLRIAERRVKGLEEKIAKADDPDEKARLRDDLKTAREDLLKVDVPANPTLCVEDDTPAALKAELIRQGGRLMVATTEAKSIENITQYSEKPDFDVFLKGHGGDDMDTGRIGRGRESVTDPALSCVLSPQPEVVRGLAATKALRGRGFLARWEYCLPVSQVGDRRPASPAVSKELRERYDRLMTALWETAYGADEFGEPTPHVVRFGAAAEREFYAFECWIEPLLKKGGRLSSLAGWGNKLCGTCVRVAAALHVADAVGADRPWADEVSAGVVRRAVRYCRDYLIAHALAAFDVMASTPVVDGAKKVAAWVAENGLAEFSKRDCFNALRRAVFDTVDDLQKSLDLLERHYQVRPKASPKRKGPGRKSSPVYEVNPLTDPPSSEVPSPGPPPGGDEPPENLPQNPQNGTAAPPPPHSADSAAGFGIPGSTDGGDGFDFGANVSEPVVVSAPDTEGPSSDPPPDPGYILVNDPDRLGVLVGAVEGTSGPVGLDTETTGLDPLKDRVRLVQVAAGPDVYVVDVFAFRRPKDALAPLFAALAGAGVVGHHLHFDLRFLAPLGFVPGRCYDTMLASQVLHAGERTPAGGRLKHTLEAAAAQELGRTLDKRFQKADWSRPLTPEMLAYAAADAAVLLPLADALRARLAAADLTATADREMRALPGVAWAGPVAVDAAAWRDLCHRDEAEKERLAGEMDALVPNPASLTGGWGWTRRAEALKAFAAAGVDLPDTKDETLAGVGHPLGPLFRAWRSADTRVKGFGRKWLAANVRAGRVLPSWQQMGQDDRAVDTGRMSCSKPNLQQIPGESVNRRCFVARPGHVLVKADYSQIELRVAAVVSGDPVMAAAYRDGVDLHTVTARAILGRQEVSKADRKLAKAVNFGLLFGQGPAGLVRYAAKAFEVVLTEAEAGAHRDTFFRTYPGLDRWQKGVRSRVKGLFSRDPGGVQECRTRGGRRRRLPVAKRRQDSGKLYPNVTEALNTPIQGTAADGLKAAIGLLWERRAECPRAVPVIFCHDEIVVEVPEPDAEAAAAWLRRAMVDGMAPLVDPVPVVVDLTVGPTWAG